MSSSATRTRLRSTLAAVAAAAALAAASVLGVAAPASAHDELLSSDPANGAALETLPEQLTLTFSGVVQGDLGGTEVQVTDAVGTAVADGEPVVTDNVVAQALAPGASGAIHVAWRVVSEDGHPIAGEFDFSVAAAATPDPTPTSAAPTASASPTEEASATPTPTAAPDEASDASPVPWIVLGVVVLFAAGGVVFLLVSRSRRKDDSAGRSDPPAGR